MVELTAVEGIYDTKTESAARSARTSCSSSTAGYEGAADARRRSRSKKGRVVSEKPVEVKMLQGTLNANRLEVTETGASDALRGRGRDDPDAGDAQSGHTAGDAAGEAHDDLFRRARCSCYCAHRAGAVAVDGASRRTPACRTRCRAFRKIATSRSRSRPPRSKCATRTRSRRSPAMSWSRRATPVCAAGRCAVFYDQEDGKGGETQHEGGAAGSGRPAADPPAGGKGGVIGDQKDQTATGEPAFST